MAAPKRKKKLRLHDEDRHWIGLRAPKSVYDSLVGLAKQDHRSLNQELVFLIEQEAAKRPK